MFNFTIKIPYQTTVNTKSYNLYKHLSKKTCEKCLLFSWKKALRTIAILEISIVLYRGSLSSEQNLIFIYFSS